MSKFCAKFFLIQITSNYLWASEVGVVKVDYFDFCIKKVLAQNLLIYIGLHCVRRSSWTFTTLATLSTFTQKKACDLTRNNHQAIIFHSFSFKSRLLQIEIGLLLMLHNW